MVAEVAADFLDRPLIFARAMRVVRFCEPRNLPLELARERVQPFDEVLVPAAPWFAARICERADYVSLPCFIGSKISGPSWGVKRLELTLS